MNALQARCGAAIIAAFATACGSANEAALHLTIEGQGRVSVGSKSCDASCELQVPLGARPTAEPAEGWQFDGWRGLCTGECVISGPGSLTALFTELPAVVVTVTGPGSVVAPGGRRCDQGTCRWPTNTALPLAPVPNPGAEFLGFSGACSGTGFCSLAAGAVEARFRSATEPLRLNFEGTGNGVVRDFSGEFSCGSSCTLQLPRGVEYDFRAAPAAGSVFGGFGGACSNQRCQVTAPATVTARFDVGRSVQVVREGNGGGSVTVNGAECADPCLVTVPADAPLTILASPDDTSRFSGFAGDCADATCTLPASGAPTAVRVRFESVLQWARSFAVPQGSINHLVLFADDAGIAIAATARGSMEVDGRLYAEPYSNRDMSPYIIEMGWDAGVHQVTSIYDYVDGGYTGTAVTALTRGLTGSIHAFGTCRQGYLQGQLCGPISTTDAVPFVLEVADGGVRTSSLRTELVFPGSYSSFTEAHRVGDSVVARFFRYVSTIGPGTSGGFFVARSDGGVTNFLTPELGNGGVRSTGECTPDGEWLLCASVVDGDFIGLGCSPSSPGGRLATYRFHPSGACVLVSRALPSTPVPRVSVRSVAPSAGGGLHIVGHSDLGPLSFSPSSSVSAAPQFWVVGHDGANFRSAWTSPHAQSITYQTPSSVIAGPTGPLLLTRNGPIIYAPGEVLFGIAPTTNDSAHVLTFDGAGNVVRAWPLLGTVANREEVWLGAMARVGEDIVVVLAGSGYTFRGQPLAPDQQLRVFVLVFRE